MLVLPGIGGSGPQHWQTLWEARNPAFRRVIQRDWERPVCAEWAGTLERAVAENDYTSLSRTLSAAASLKGSASNLGARKLAALCDEIEQTAKNWSLAEVLPLVERARAELARVRSALEKIKAG